MSSTGDRDERPARRLGRDLDCLRLDAGLSIRALSRRTGCPVSTLGDALRGRRFPRLETVLAVARACDASTEHWRDRWVEAQRDRRSQDASIGAVQVDADAGQRVRTVGSGQGGRRSELPLATRHFVGRNSQIDQLRALLTNPVGGTGTVVIGAVDGMAGIGKTALAVHTAHRISEQFPDGALFVDLHGYTAGSQPTPAEAALASLLRRIGIPGDQIPTTLDDRSALWRNQLTGKRILLVLDNARDPAQVQPLLPGTSGCSVLITSRTKLTLDDAHQISLDVLDSTAAVRLLASVASDGRVSDDPEAAEKIVSLCGFLPLAIRICAARLRARPRLTLTGFAQRLAAEQRRLAELDDGTRSVATAFAISYHGQPKRHRSVFRLLGLAPGPDFDAYSAAALANIHIHKAEHSLNRLLEANLIHQTHSDRYRFHDLLRCYAADLARRDESQRRAALARLYDHYTRTASVAADILYPHEAHQHPNIPGPSTPAPALNDQKQAAAWLDAEHANLLAAAAHAAGHAMPTHTVHLSAVLLRHLRTRAYYTEAESLHTLAVHTADQINDFAGEMSALLGLAHVKRAQDQHGPATQHFERALALARRIGHRGGEIDALIGLGEIHRIKDQYAPASEYLTLALEIAREIGYHGGERQALTRLGNIHRIQGRHGPAANYYRQALDLARHIGDRVGELNALDGLGEVFRKQGRHGPAAAHLERALEIAREIGNRVGELNTLIYLGHLHRAQGRHRPATEHFERVLALAREIGDRNFQFEALHGLGRTRWATSHIHQALAYHQQALDIADALSQPTDQARAHNGIARAHHTLGHHHQAHHHWHRVVDILTSLGITKIDEDSIDDIRDHLATHDNPNHTVGTPTKTDDPVIHREQRSSRHTTVPGSTSKAYRSDNISPPPG